MLFGKSYKQINGAMSLQIHENTAIDATAPEGEIVHTQYPRNGRVREGEGANMGKQGIAADVHAEMMKQSRPCFPTEGKRNMREPVVERARATSIGSEEGGEAFSEGEGEVSVMSANILKTQTGKMGEQGGDTHDSDSL